MLWMMTAERPELSETAHCEHIVRLAESGLALVTLRSSAFPETTGLCRAARRIKQDAPRLTVFVRGEPDLASRCGADGLHLSSRDLDKVRAVRRSFPALRIAVSTHAPDEFEQAFAEGADFAIYGPIFPPLSKPDDPRQTVPPVRRSDLYLIGGINRDRADRLIRQGFRDLAAVSLFYSQTAYDEIRYLVRLMHEVIS